MTRFVFFGLAICAAICAFAAFEFGYSSVGKVLFYVAAALIIIDSFFATRWIAKANINLFKRWRRRETTEQIDRDKSEK